MQHISLDYDFSPNLNHTMRRSRTLKRNTVHKSLKIEKSANFIPPQALDPAIELGVIHK